MTHVRIQRNSRNQSRTPAMADILVVEDDRAMLRGLQENLEFEGHIVRTAGRGDEAVARLGEARPDLLILDVMLPGRSGFEICRQLRLTDKKLPILLLTARNEQVDKVMGLDLGADDYLTKPFDLSELLARVRALLRRASKEQHTRLPVSLVLGDVTLDFERYVATRSGVEAHLTPKEFSLLRHLAAAEGAAVRRDVLIERVWGEDVNITNRTVDTHILSLRQKLESDPASPRYILTVHAVGYRLRTEP
jgi:DNA-binding response OmpR family regulator